MLSVDGFYFPYMTGTESQGMAMFVFRAGMLVGADPLGVTFNGTYALDEVTAKIAGHVKVYAPPNGTLIQGVSTGPSGITYGMPFEVPEAFAEEPFVRLQTPLGPVNMKLKRLRGLEANEP